MRRTLYLVRALMLAACLTPGAFASAGDFFTAIPLKVSTGSQVGLKSLPASQTGVHFTNFLSESKVLQRQNSLNGSGVAAADYDGDGLTDLFFCNKEGPSALYKNLGNWKFANVSEKAGVSCVNQSSSGAVFGDLNGDGKLDLVVSAFGGPNAAFLNLGNGAFTNITQRSGLSANGNCTSMALGDVDGDGDLDLYMCNFGVESILRDGGKIAVKNVGGKSVVQGRYAKRVKIIGNELVEFGEPDVLYLNDGAGQFSPAPWGKMFFDEDGKPSGELLDFGLAVQLRDINADGTLDIYVCNDMQTPDRIWVGDGKGRFNAAPRNTVRNMSYASMGVDFADINRDGHLDFLTVEMLPRDHAYFLRQTSPITPVIRRIGEVENKEDVPRNVLGLNRGDGTYADIAFYAGVAATDWSWMPIFLDVDLDGYDDLLVSNGHLYRVNDRDSTALFEQNKKSGAKRTMGVYPPIDSPNAIFRNTGDSKFADKGKEWGFNSTNLSHGMILADLDNDGDQDVVVNCLNAPALLYENTGGAPRVAVRLKGKNSNVIGAKISLIGGLFDQQQEVLAGGRYLSSDDFSRSFAALHITNRFSIHVIWRNGAVSTVTGVKANHSYEISEEGAKQPLPKTAKPIEKPWFEDISAQLNATHYDQDSNDLELQPTLPFKLGQRGPGLGWIDLNQDGFDDFVMGAGAGSKAQVFLNKGGKSFEPAASQTNFRFGTSGLAARVNKGKPVITLCAANHARTKAEPTGLVELSLGKAGLEIHSAQLEPGMNPSALAIADIDGDGDLDQFVGARSAPGQYPLSAGAKLLINENGKLAAQPAFAAISTNLGMVNGALFADLDNDGFAELAIATEWGPVRVLKNNKGQFEDITEKLGLNKYKGLWNGITAADVDADGRLDLIASNLGRNSHYELRFTKPPRLYYHDFNNDGVLDILPAFYIEEQRQYMPYDSLPALLAFMPQLKERFPTHKAYGAASIETVLGDANSKAKYLEATWLDSTVFLNRGNSFEAFPLPAEAQFAPAFGISTADFNGDGSIDIFLAQNLFAVRPTDSRLDAGRGLLLKNDGKGVFKSIPGQASGIKIYGEQRGSAAADFNQDGRMDLAVGQNGAQTKLYRNTSARPALRVKLNGGPENPDGIGAIAWIEEASGKRLTPVQQATAGTGFWSQDSATLLMFKTEAASHLAVRWPGGKTTRTAIPAESKAITAASN